MSNPTGDLAAEPHARVTVYTKPGCVQCDATFRLMDARGIPYTPVDVTTDPDALKAVRGLGYLQAPVVVAGGRHWSGYRPDEITRLREESREVL
jgi:glutaredoxin-like protein NrdH